MDENRFRSLMRGAIGDEAMSPWLADAVRTRVATARPVVTSRRWIVLVAAALVAVLVAGIAGQRLLLQRQSNPIVPAATPRPHASPTPVDPFSCRLPVAIDPWSAPVDYQLRVGFLDTRTGKYTGDRSASVAGLAPLSSQSRPTSYSPAAKRWLPVAARNVSPDGLRYAWTDPSTLHLHVYDLASGTDRLIWSHAGAGGVMVWGGAGIYVALNPTTDSQTQTWLVDPDTGRAAQVIPKSHFSFTPLATDPLNTGFRSVGLDANGHMIWWLYFADQRGSPQSAFYEMAPGQRVYIYRGTQGDGTGFDPGSFIDDATGKWFSALTYPYIWHWSQQSGLHKISAAGAPRGATFMPAGSCF
ncbi:MAG: hypothetical protein E6I34_12805 [Chloroflexi bacterium]|nr:MAG: hypothetical protein E6I34_12805 [Chloroflexota bacterium]